MKRGSWLKKCMLTAAAVGLCFAAGSQAAVIEWGGGDGEYTVASNWVGNAVPDLTIGTNTARISSGAVTYTPGGDLAIHNGATLQISGGSFEQVGGVAWMQFQNGNLLVDGGTFSQGTAGNLLRDASSSITCSAGTLTWTGNLIYDPVNTGALSISGTGRIETAGEFKPISTLTMTGGTLACSLISFADGAGYVDLSGGQVEVDGSNAFSGFYGAGGGKSINFTPGSTGTLFIDNYDLAELTSDNFLNNGTVTYNGGIDSTKFAKAEQDGGVAITLLSGTNSVPTGLVGISGYEQISLSWNAVSSATNYNVKRSLVSEGPYSVVATSAVPAYVDTGLTNGTTYYYVVSADVDGSESADSSEISATPAIQKPTGLAAVGAYEQVSLTWNAVTGATEYFVKRSVTNGGPYSVIATSAVPNAVDTDVINGTTYYYVVSASDGVDESVNSTAVNATPNIAAPTGLSAVAGDEQVSLYWNAVSGATSYNIKRALSGAGPFAVVATSTVPSVVDTAVTNGTTYYYVVSTVAGVDESSDSAQVNATPAPPVVYTWGGTDGEYTVASNWVGDVVPDLNVAGNTALITAGDVKYNAGPDLAIHNGSTLQISGGSWEQTNGISWIQMGGGNLIVDGGTFTQGTAANIVRDSASSITVSAGTANFNTIFTVTSNNGSFAISGTGVVNVGVEFQPIKTFNMSAGTLTAQLISFVEGPGSVNLSGGRIEVDGSSIGNGLYAAGAGKGVNFTTGSTGALFFGNYTVSNLTADALLSNGKIMLDGLVDAGAFSAIATNGGVEVVLASTNGVPITDDEYVIASSAVTGGTNISLTVTGSVSGHAYQVLATDTLTPADWQPVGSAQSGDGGTLVFDIAIESTSTNRFFKLDVQQE